MKNRYNFKFLYLLPAIFGVLLYGCSDDFLNTDVQGQLTEDQVATPAGVETLLIGAYAMLDGNLYGTNWESSGSNWVYGSVASDDAAKGSDSGDQAPINPIETFDADASNPFFNVKWRAVYEGISRANNTIKILANVEGVSEATRTRISAEARFLRAHYHFDAKKIWNNVPFLDETVIYGEGDFNVGNTTDVWPRIEEDFKFAYDNLASSGMAVGRANKWAAASYLAKAYMFQGKFAEALPLLENIIANGETQLGLKYDLLDEYHHNFNAEFKNGAESVFAIQASVNDGAGGANANFDQVLNFPHGAGAPGGCCGFFQPTFDLVNAHRTSAIGLPLPDSYRQSPLVTDQGVAAGASFTPDAGNVDPRLDWTVGRRGIPYLDWGPHPGVSWIRLQPYGGPYSPKKMVFYEAQQGSLTDVSFWTPGLTAINYQIIRFADVLLWAAEAAAEQDQLGDALDYANRVRNRAANPDGFVVDEDGDPAANYVISPYLAFTSKADALEKIRFERRIELAMEGHRRFDLVRWGLAVEVLNSFIDYEVQFRQYLQGAEFEATDIYFPIPQRQIDLQTLDGESPLKQNDGYQ